MRLVPRSVIGRSMLAAGAAVLITAGSGAIALALVAGPGVDASGGTAGVTVALAAAALVAAAIALLLARIVASAVTMPLERLTRRVEAGTVSRAGWSPGDAPAEIARLAGAMRDFAGAAAERYAAAEAERDRSATLLRGMGDAVLIVTSDDRLEDANPAAQRLLGMAGAVGRRLAEVARDHELLATVDEARREGSASSQIDRLDPRRSIRVAAWRLPAGDVLVTAQDLTTVRRLETVRRDFVANVSHELRTPIASIKAMVETLESGALDDKEAAWDFVGRIHREVDDLAQLVTELLSLARIESGADALDLRRTDPTELLRTAADRMRALSERADIHVRVEPSGAAGVMADGEKIATVLVNLIHNAIKFTPAGGSVTLQADPVDGSVAFSVRDSGIGIAREDLDRIFERFFKSGDTARSQEGTGLGLAIARHIVLAHGGTIHAESEGPGRGSLFRFTLPVAPEEARQAEATSSDDGGVTAR